MEYGLSGYVNETHFNCSSDNNNTLLFNKANSSEVTVTATLE